METPHVSIIIPVFKVEKYINTCVDSVINQTYKNWELILVDDGSPDNCPAICDEYEAKDKRIKVFHKVNGGVSSARNIALDNFQGEFVAFLDSDDFWHSEYLATLLDLCLKNGADIAQCAFVRGTENIFPQNSNKKKIKFFDNHTVFLRGAANIVVWGKLYKGYLFEGIKMPENKKFEDDFTTWKWYYKAKKIVLINSPLYYYTQNDLSTMSSYINSPNLDYIEAYEERIAFFSIRGAKDMEDYSRAHLCKSLLLISGNPLLSKEQKKIVNKTFQSNWHKIRFSDFVPFYLQVLFFMFSYLPKPTLFLLKLLRN